MDDVKVHYNSDKPAQVNALAYAQGNDIHIGPSQEKHLPHEAWHVVQQKQGRVKPTMQLNEVNINDDKRLEAEADYMGEAATKRREAPAQRTQSGSPSSRTVAQLQRGIQLKVDKYRNGAWYSNFDPYTIFATKREATMYDRDLRKNGREPLRARVPTLYTYTHTKPTNKLSYTLQGPHTVAYRVILQALIDAEDEDDLFEIFDEQVLEPSDVEEILTQDEAPASGAFQKTIEERLERFINDYTSYYNEFESLYNSPSPDLITLKHLLNQLLNMYPYGVYAWKTTQKASHKSLSGKGESVTNPTWADMYDAPPTNSFRDQDNLDSFVEARQTLFNSHF